MMFNYIQSTRFKVQVARVIYRLLMTLKFQRFQIVNRMGINFAIDLAEGIDLSLFLLGSFQSHVSNNRHFHLPDDAIICDIGANCGAISLALAHKYPRSLVFSFEPTDYAFAKLKRNISLNPNVANRLKIFQLFISNSDNEPSSFKAYPSWPLDGDVTGRHPVHCGVSKPMSTACLSLDRFVVEQKLARIDFVKIDTDGNELAVLQGMKKCLLRIRPVIIFELSTYLLKENGEDFGQYEAIFHEAQYDLFTSKSCLPVSCANLHKLVPSRGSLDILALPQGRVAR